MDGLLYYYAFLRFLNHDVSDYDSDCLMRLSRLSIDGTNLNLIHDG